MPMLHKFQLNRLRNQAFPAGPAKKFSNSAPANRPIVESKIVYVHPDKAIGLLPI